MRRYTKSFVMLVVLIAFATPDPAETGRRRGGHEALGHQLFASPQVNPIVLSEDGSLLL